MAKDQNFQILLDAENEAEQIIEQARKYRDQLLEDTLQDTRQQEALFEQRIPEIRDSALNRAVQHADQVILDYQNRHNVRSIEIREQAEERELEALDSAFFRLLNSEG